VYGEHRRREIRPRSRFIEVPNCKTPATTGSYKHLCLETPAGSRVLLLGTSKNRHERVKLAVTGWQTRDTYPVYGDEFDQLGN
jgi:hypothetical protein